MKNLITILTEKAGDKLAQRNTNLLNESVYNEFEERLKQFCIEIGLPTDVLITYFFNTKELLYFIYLGDKNLFEQICKILPTVDEFEKDKKKKLKKRRADLRRIDKEMETMSCNPDRWRKRC